MCIQCLKQHVNIAEQVDAEQSILFCRECGRYSVSGDKFVPAELESPQLMGLCLKRIRGLKDTKILDARFLWTEPHSKRVKVRLVLQKEVLNSTLIEQEHIVTFVVTSTMCEDCQYSYTDHTWSWAVQVRQKVVHKRTFLFLEQEIMKQRSLFDLYDIDTQTDGIDFFFMQKSACLRFVDFLHSRVPGRHSETEKLISADLKSNTAHKKHTVLFEIAALCKDDLVVVPKKLRGFVGSLQRLCVVYKIGQRIHLVDPLTGETASLTAMQYFGCPFGPIRTRKQRQRVQVLYCEDKGAYVQSEADCEDGVQHYCYTHLSEVLKEEQDIWVYDSTLIDFADLELPKNYKCEQKYIIVSRAKKADEQRVRRMKDNKLVEKQEDYEDDDVEAVLEMEDDGFEPELEAEEVEVDGEGVCPQ